MLSPRGGGSGKQKGGGAADAAGADNGGGGEDGTGGTVDKGEVSRKRGRIARCSSQWLDTRTFATTAECVAALKEDGREVWATDLDPVGHASGQGAEWGFSRGVTFDGDRRTRHPWARTLPAVCRRTACVS